MPEQICFSFLRHVLTEARIAEPSEDLDSAVEELKQQGDIKKALQQTADAQPAPSTVKKKQKFFLGTYVAVLLGLGGLYYLSRLHLFERPRHQVSEFQGLELGRL